MTPETREAALASGLAKQHHELHADHTAPAFRRIDAGPGLLATVATVRERTAYADVHAVCSLILRRWHAGGREAEFFYIGAPIRAWLDDAFDDAPTTVERGLWSFIATAYDHAVTLPASQPLPF